MTKIERIIFEILTVPPTNPSDQCTLYDTNINGNDIGSPLENIGRMLTCQRYCIQDDQCKFWSYDYIGKKCYKKSSDENIGFKGNFMTGAKDCSPKHVDGKEWKKRRYFVIYKIPCVLCLNTNMWASKPKVRYVFLPSRITNKQ